MSGLVCIGGIGVLLKGGIKSMFRASSRTLNLSIVRGVYWRNLVCFGNSLGLLRGRMGRCASSTRQVLASSLTFVLNSRSSSSYINFVALYLSSSMLLAGVFHKLSDSGPDFNAITN